MNPPETTTGKKGEPYTIIATVKSQWKSIATIIALGLLVVSCALAFVNYRTYKKMAEYNIETINNYKIRNRPFVKIEPINIVVKKKQIPYPKGGQLGSNIYPFFKLKNFGQFPAFIEDINIWITDISGVSTIIKFPKASEHQNTKNLALFQNEEKEIPWKFFFINKDIEKITKAKEEDYFIFKINYKILSNEKSLQKPFSYWVKCKHVKYHDKQEETEYRFWTKECGTDDISPDT